MFSILANYTVTKHKITIPHREIALFNATKRHQALSSVTDRYIALPNVTSITSKLVFFYETNDSNTSNGNPW